jgi:hypothetical protein
MQFNMKTNIWVDSPFLDGKQRIMIKDSILLIHGKQCSRFGIFLNFSQTHVFK